MKNIFKIAVVSLGVAAIGITGCKKSFLDRNPSNQAATDDVFKTIEGFEAAVQGMHRMIYEVVDHDVFGIPSMAITWDLMGEDFIPSGYGAGWFVTQYRYNDARNGSGAGSYMWTFHYRLINNANQILSRIDAMNFDPDRKAYVKASALFYRAYAYFNLAQCYMHTYAGSTSRPTGEEPIPAPINFVGEYKKAPCVPIYTAPTQSPNPRATVEEVYSRITTDLGEAITLFTGSTTARSDKSELNLSVAQGLRARVALVMQDWDIAASMAHEARQGYPYMNSPAQIYDGFTNAANGEWIWGSIINTEQNGIYASFLSHLDFYMGGYASLGMQKKMNSQFLATTGELSIDSTDLRRQWWRTREQVTAQKLPITPNGQVKFHARSPGNWAADFPLMRAAEMGLIEAEALAQDGQVGQAAAVLEEFVKTRQPNFTAPATGTALVKEIWKQRRIELWGEGFRFFDIVRSFASPLNTNTLGLNRTSTGASSSIAGGLTQLGQYNTQFLWRIPASETNVNRDIPQNP